jgi:hypothetical protein
LIKIDAYYILVKNDFDGTAEFFGPMVLSVLRQTLGTFNAYPNPTRDILNYNFENLNSGETKISVLSTIGQLLFTEVITLQDGNASGVIDMKGLRQGVYYLHVSNRDRVVKTIKFVITN